MNIRKLGPEHSVCVDLLPERPTVLDVGCRGFEFDLELLKLRPQARILALDPDPAIPDPQIPRITFQHRAVTEKLQQWVQWQGEGDGAYICAAAGDPGYGWGVSNTATACTVENTNIPDLMKEFSVDHWDIVKLDCEGSEFGILENWPGPIATQLSIEFHDCINPARWNAEYYVKLFAGPLRFYRLALWGLTPLGPGDTMGHWDSLLVLRP
jgi:FkbM family methyltransferase